MRNSLPFQRNSLQSNITPHINNTAQIKKTLTESFQRKYEQQNPNPTHPNIKIQYHNSHSNNNKQSQTHHQRQKFTLHQNQINRYLTQQPNIMFSAHQQDNIYSTQQQKQPVQLHPQTNIVHSHLKEEDNCTVKNSNEHIYLLPSHITFQNYSNQSPNKRSERLKIFDQRTVSKDKTYPDKDSNRKRRNRSKTIFGDFKKLQQDKLTKNPVLIAKQIQQNPKQLVHNPKWLANKSNKEKQNPIFYESESKQQVIYLKLELQRYKRCEKLSAENESLYESLLDKLKMKGERKRKSRSPSKRQIKEYDESPIGSLRENKFNTSQHPDLYESNSHHKYSRQKHFDTHQQQSQCKHQQHSRCRDEEQRKQKGETDSLWMEVEPPSKDVATQQRLSSERKTIELTKEAFMEALSPFTLHNQINPHLQEEVEFNNKRQYIVRNSSDAVTFNNTRMIGKAANQNGRERASSKTSKGHQNNNLLEESNKKLIYQKYFGRRAIKSSLGNVPLSLKLQEMNRIIQIHNSELMAHQKRPNHILLKKDHIN